MKYFVVYYIASKQVTGINSAFVKVNYNLNENNLKRLELKLVKSLDADKVTVLSYKKVVD